MSADIEKKLIEHLGDERKLDPNQIKRLSATVAKLQASSFAMKRVYWKGTPVPDEILIHGHSPLNGEFSIFKELLSLKNVVKVEVFPIGVPVLNEMEINVRLGGF